MQRRFRLVVLAAASVVSALGQEGADPVARLIRAIADGKTTLAYQERFGYLPSLLERLDVNADSQALVFSKTSFQQDLITPQRPRAVFFNDTVTVGSVQGGEVFELTSLDPVRGVIFYTLGARPSDKARFERREAECIKCHGPVSAFLPGLMVASTYPRPDGTPAYTGSLFKSTDHRTPFSERWGGWYVTGTHGSQTHIGNAVAPDPSKPFDLETKGTQNLTSLEGKIDTSKYLVPSSDIVALMTLEHQTQMTNLITSLTGRMRFIGSRGDVKGVKPLDAAIDEIVEYMLFVDEARLTEPVKGTSTFTETFPKRGPRDKKGRSLRDFDLKTRLFRYPLSYMIYSEAFDGIPAEARDRVYRKLYAVLTGKDTSPKFARLSSEDRRAALEIVTETKAGLPSYWTAE